MIAQFSTEKWKELQEDFKKAHDILFETTGYKEKGFSVKDKISAQSICGGFALFIESKLEEDRIRNQVKKEAYAIKSV